MEEVCTYQSYIANKSKHSKKTFKKPTDEYASSSDSAGALDPVDELFESEKPAEFLLTCPPALLPSILQNLHSESKAERIFTGDGLLPLPISEFSVQERKHSTPYVFLLSHDSKSKLVVEDEMLTKIKHFYVSQKSE